MLLLIFTILLFVIYAGLIIFYWVNWRAMPEFLAKENNHTTTFSVIIPARNEEENIGKLLRALEMQTCDKTLARVTVVDDHSTDHTAEIAQESGVKLIELPDEPVNSYKKKAIETGVKASAAQLMITTDADCLPPPAWLETILAFYQEQHAAFIAAPVMYRNNGSLLQVFQSLDFLVLQGITAASVHKKIHALCNGANLAYEKTVFEAVNGFEGIDTIASGDDLLLMHKIWRQFPDRVFYLKSKKAIVVTQPMKTWKEFLNQRIRWASKARFYKDKRIFSVLLLVYLFNLSFFALLVAGIWDKKFLLLALLLWFLKTMVELPFVYSVARFFEQQSLLKYFFFLQPLHIAYTVVAGFLGQFGKYEWKGRMVR